VNVSSEINRAKNISYFYKVKNKFEGRNVSEIFEDIKQGTKHEKRNKVSPSFETDISKISYSEVFEKNLPN
jgi:hypothetical protein